MLKGTLDELTRQVKFLEQEDLHFNEHYIESARRDLKERETEINAFAKTLKEMAGKPEFYETLAIIITDLRHAVEIAQHDAEVAGADTAYGRG